VGSDDDWNRAEAALAKALNAKNLSWEELPGEGAFYGPKIEFSLKDCIGRIWQLGTIQVDFSMPGRLDAQYVAEDGARKVPVMLHRAVLGSFERFIGILIEHYEGAFPLWLAPRQAVVVNITDKHAGYAGEVAERLRAAGFRVEADLRNEKIGFKIRELELAKVPYVIVVGDKEVASETVSVRARHGRDLGSLSHQDLLQTLTEEMSRKGRAESH
jgi:threonyl-tRNA synthetase